MPSLCVYYDLFAIDAVNEGNRSLTIELILHAFVVVEKYY